MHKSPFLAAAASAAFLITGCDSGPVTVNQTAPEVNKAPPLDPQQLPPSMIASKIYRCADNSLFYVDFMSNGTANIRRGARDAAPTLVTAEGGNPPYTAEGYSLSGDGDNVTLNGKSCRTGPAR